MPRFRSASSGVVRILPSERDQVCLGVHVRVQQKSVVCPGRLEQGLAQCRRNTERVGQLSPGIVVDYLTHNRLAPHSPTQSERSPSIASRPSRT